MVYRKIVNPALARLNGARALYFSSVIDAVERDSRLESAPNLVFLVLKETIPYLPTYLPENDLIEKLFAFVGDNQVRLTRIIHDRRYIEDPTRLSEVTKEFVLKTLSDTLEAHEANEIQETKIREARTYRFSWPEMETNFPYRDEDE